MKLIPLFLSGVQKADAVNITDALLLSLIGMGIVFFVLMLLMLTISVLTRLSGRQKPLPAGGPVQPVIDREAAALAARAGKIPAPGALGECDLYTVDDQTAALLMAIVADDLKLPLNELRFISIRELS